jgi:hypothetical protein
LSDKEREMRKIMFEYQLELFEQQGREIAALKEANASLQWLHTILEKLMKATADRFEVS